MKYVVTVQQRICKTWDIEVDVDGFGLAADAALDKIDAGLEPTQEKIEDEQYWVKVWR